MFKFLIGVAFGAAGYWAWQSFGRDLLGMGGDQDMTYGGFTPSSNSSFSSGSTTGSPASATPSTSSSSTSSEGTPNS